MTKKFKIKKLYAGISLPGRWHTKEELEYRKELRICRENPFVGEAFTIEGQTTLAWNFAESYLVIDREFRKRCLHTFIKEKQVGGDS